MIRHIHYDFQNGHIIMKIFGKYKDNRNGPAGYYIDSHEVTYASVPYQESIKNEADRSDWDDLVDAFLTIKKKTKRTVSISVSENIERDPKLLAFVEDVIDYVNADAQFKKMIKLIS